MLNTLLTHELLNILKSRRVYWTVVIFLLLFASVFIVRLIDYQKQIAQYITEVKHADESIRGAVNYGSINPKAIQQPLVFSIYNEGLKIPRVANIQYYEPIINAEDMYSEVNRLFIENTKLDITFLITFFLSLFILLISYDSVNGEKQVGTLRLIMTYPLKRQSFILKKVLGVFIFIAFTFTIPYLLSLITLVIIFANMLTLGFFLSAFFYWFLVLLFIFFFTLLGIFISTSTTNPNRSLVYSLLVWILFAIILPISWDYIAEPRLFNNKLTQLNRVVSDKLDQTRKIMFVDVPEEADINKVGHMNWSNFFYDSLVWGWNDTYEQHYRFQRYIIDNYYPVSREAEQAIDEVLRRQISIDNTRNWVFFYDPIVLFANLATKITGNAREDYQRFLQDSRAIRDELVNLGISEGWLLDSRFFAIYKPEYDLGTFEEMLAKVGISDIETQEDWEKLYEYIMGMMNNAERFEFDTPYIRPYAQPQYTFGEIFNRIWQYLLVFVVSILVLWLLTWQKFMTYDVR